MILVCPPRGETRSRVCRQGVEGLDIMSGSEHCGSHYCHYSRDYVDDPRKRMTVLSRVLQGGHRNRRYFHSEMLTVE